jgi:3-deoxy-D-manno-octulosonate 8-phosphate phosphatase KdsC-like HAD superfamily phosphatase
MIKLIVSEIDGVLTSGVSQIDNVGITLFKDFYLGDFEAINKLKNSLRFVFLSSDNNVNYNICSRKCIPFYWAPKDKRTTLLEILRHYNYSAEETFYIGSSISDIPCMNMIPLSFCTNPLLGFSTFKTQAGKGVLTELYLNLQEYLCL